MASASEFIAPENDDISTPENKETSSLSSTNKKRCLEEDEDIPTVAETVMGSSVLASSEAGPRLSSEVKTANKKRRLGEDIPTIEQTSDKTAVGTSVGFSFLVRSQTSPEDLRHKNRRLDNEPSGLDSLGEVENGANENTEDSLTSSIAATLTATAAPVAPISALTPTSPSHVTSVQISVPAGDPRIESSSGDIVLNAIPALSPPAETQVKEKDHNTRSSKKARLDLEPGATKPAPASSITRASTEPFAVAISEVNIALQMDVLPKPSPFVVLPVELLSEILIYTGSPQYVLAVARTCKALCQTLLISNNQFIWKETRKACAFNLKAGPVSLPDPPKTFFGEAAYAAFVFDSGTCENCGKETNMMHASFALRIRLCKDSKCRNSLTDTLLLKVLHAKLYTAVIPVTESNACSVKITEENHLTFHPIPLNYDYCRASDFDNAKAWIDNSPKDEAFHQKYERIRARNIEWMEFAVSLQKWNYARQARYYVVRNFNESQTRKFADKFGWKHLDMMNNTIYGSYCRKQNKIMEKVKETDVRVLIEQIESQLLVLSERRSRHSADVAFLKNRSEIEKHYNKIQSSKVYPFLPSLPTFCQLPIINLLQSAPTAVGVSIDQTLASDSLMRGLLSDQLKQWVETAKDDFAVLLGFPKKWNTASKNVVHPVERVTARFLCIRCGTKAKDRGSRTNGGSLDFAAACRHVCSTGEGRAVKGKKGKWGANKFVKDEKAIHAMKKIVQTLNYSEEKAGPRDMIALGLSVLCTSCDPPMVVDSRGVVGHCHRHDAMELSLTSSVDTITSYLGGYPFIFGLTEKLMGPEGLSIKGKKAIGSKNYGCRHCLRVKQVESSAAAGETNSEPLEAVQLQLSTLSHRMHDLGVEGPREKPPPLFNFNGVISHMKAKHRIETIRDEDLLCYDNTDL